MFSSMEEEFEDFFKAIYGTQEVSIEQRKDVERSFYAGMIVMYQTVISLDEDEDIAMEEMDAIRAKIIDKAKELS